MAMWANVPMGSRQMYIFFLTVHVFALSSIHNASIYHWCVSALAAIYTKMCTPKARVRRSVFTAIILLGASALWVCIRMPVKGTMACLVAFVQRGTDLISANVIVTIQLELNRHSRKTYIIPDRSIILTREMNTFVFFFSKLCGAQVSFCS